MSSESSNVASLNEVISDIKHSPPKNENLIKKESTPLDCKVIPSLVCYDISSGSEDEDDQGFSVPLVKKEVVDPTEEMEVVKEGECNYDMKSEVPSNTQELLTAESSINLVDDLPQEDEVTILQNYEHRETVTILSDTENEPSSSGFSSDSDPDSTSSSSDDESSSESSSEDDSTSVSSSSENTAPLTSSNEIKEKEKGQIQREDDSQPLTNGPPTPAVQKEQEEKNVSKTKKNKKKDSLEDDYDLPPIEDLQISVREDEAKAIGSVVQIVEDQVVIQAYPDLPAINLDSVLFVDRGSRALGRVFDVFGPVQQPLYVVRLAEKEVPPKGTLVYFAPQTEHTNYVILDELLCDRGSDASWKHNQEPPVELLDYSDDEEERKAKQAHRNSRRAAKESQSTITHELESSFKKPRQSGTNTHRNPFVRNFEQQRRSLSLPRTGNAPSFNRRPEEYPMDSGRHWRSRQPGYKPNFQFGAPPQFNAPTPPLPFFSNNNHRPPSSPQPPPPSAVSMLHIPPPIQNRHLPPPSQNTSPGSFIRPPPPSHIHSSATPPPSFQYNNEMPPPPRLVHHQTTTASPPLFTQNSRPLSPYSNFHIQNANVSPQPTPHSHSVHRGPTQHNQNNHTLHNIQNTHLLYHIPNTPPPSHHYIPTTPPPPHISSTPPPPPPHNPSAQPPPHHIPNTQPPPLHIPNTPPPPPHIPNNPHHIQNDPRPPLSQNTPHPHIPSLSLHLPPQRMPLPRSNDMVHQMHTHIDRTPFSNPLPSSPSANFGSNDLSFLNRPPPPLPPNGSDLAHRPPAAPPPHFQTPFNGNYYHQGH